MEQGTDANSGGGREVQKGREIGLQEVLTGIERVGISGVATSRIFSVACDSRKVMPGALFFALPGHKADGNRFVGEAIARGAVAIASGDARNADITGVRRKL
jgi:UDP-N-acetylmuramyl pentapeptide synthase